MKFLKRVVIAVLVVAMSLTITGQVLAGRGYHGNSGNGTWANPPAGTSVNGAVYGSGAGYGTCPYGGTGAFAGVNIFENAPAVTVSGTVSEILYYGGGLQIDTGEESIAVYGMGPFWYWNQLEIDRPTVDDEISVDGYEVTYTDGSVRIVAANVTVNGHDVALRDVETGAPLWRSQNTSGYVRGGRGQGNCLWAPVSAPEE